MLTLAEDFAGSANDNTYSYSYTNAHQLASAGVSIAAWQWQPPAAASTSYVPNNLNQYASVGGVSYSYDAKGNLTSDGTWGYTYDAENRLLTAQKVGLAAAYAYDPLGVRTLSLRTISKSVGTGTTPLWGSAQWGNFAWTAAPSGPPTFYVSSGTDEIAEYDSSGNLITRYVPGPAIDEPIAEVTASGTHTYYHTDRQGSVAVMSDASGALVEGPYVYDPYGNCFVGSTPLRRLRPALPLHRPPLRSRDRPLLLSRPLLLRRARPLPADRPRRVHRRPQPLHLCRK